MGSLAVEINKKLCYRSDFKRRGLLYKAMSLLDRYILKEWLVGFMFTLFVVVGILILQNMYETLPDLLGCDAGLSQIIFYYSLALPSYLPAIFPVALLVSLLFCLGSLHKNNEILAMRASGAGLFRISRSLWGAGFLLSLLLLYLAKSLVPKSVEQSRTFLDNLEFSAQEARYEASQVGLLYNLGFDNRKDGRLWFMNRFSERAWLGLGVNVHTRDVYGQELSRITAAEAYYDDTQGHWVFLDGRELLLDAQTGDPLRAQSFDEKKFSEFDEDPNLMLALHKKPKELSLYELRSVMEAMPPSENPNVRSHLVQYFSLLATPFSCLVVIGIAVPFALSGIRINPMIGVSKALGFFVIFYVLVAFSTILGGREIIPALLAAWIPNLVMLLVSLRLFSKV